MANTRKAKVSSQSARASHTTAASSPNTTDSQRGVAKPELLSKGNYAIFQAPNGDGVVAYRPEGETKDSHQVVPAKFWLLFLKMIRGELEGINPMDLMKAMMGK